jgi:hypothetical protein
MAPFLIVAILALVSPVAAQLPTGFTAKDIGLPGAPGSTTVDAAGLWTIKGSGIDIWAQEDHFQFAYQPVKGDGSISARILSADGGHATWHKAGPMIRNSDGADARNVLLYMTSGEGLEYQWRPTDGADTVIQRDIQPRRFPLYLRLQRAGNEFAGFASEDGRLWRSITGSPVFPMEETALWGLAVTSHEDGEITTATFNQVAVQPGLLSPSNLRACGGDKSVLLTWNPVPNAAGYRVRRGAPQVAADALTPLTPEPINQNSFTDSSEGLTNGSPALYAVAPVFKAADGTLTEGAMTATLGTPIAPPPGLMGCGLVEGMSPGSASYDAATGEITIRAAGGDIWDAADQGYFLQQPMEGNFQITARILSQPTNTSGWAKAGPMIRESLDPGARATYLYATPGNGASFQWRTETDGHTALFQALDADSLKVPLLLRLIRRGNEISAEVSLDDGQTYKPAADPFTYERALPARLYVGLAATSHNSGQVTEAKFNALKIEKL